MNGNTEMMNGNTEMMNGNNNRDAGNTLHPCHNKEDDQPNHRPTQWIKDKTNNKASYGRKRKPSGKVTSDEFTILMHQFQASGQQLTKWCKNQDDIKIGFSTFRKRMMAWKTKEHHKLVLPSASSAPKKELLTCKAAPYKTASSSAPRKEMKNKPTGAKTTTFPSTNAKCQHADPFRMTLCELAVSKDDTGDDDYNLSSLKED